ncbi:MAG: hypothetical protein JWN82_101 [Candidatus Saccharibacteria bacterium]|nr:hypothetical protein [Candidatus Saccharibacteria bacterium]
MSDNKSDSATKTPKIQSNNLVTFGATLSGIVVGVVTAMAMMGPMLHDQLASATKDLHRTIATAPASVTSACVVPSDGLGSSANSRLVSTAQQSMPEGGRGGDGTPNSPSTPSSSGGKTWVHNFVGGVWAKNTATISNTGSDSNNVIKTTNRNTTVVSNHNNVDVTNNNHQSANSGDVESENNTTAGEASSGTASNTSRSEYEVTINN